MANGGFLSGLIGVAVGALLATLFGTGRNDAPAPRSDVARLERAIARLETALLQRSERPRVVIKDGDPSEPAPEGTTTRPAERAPAPISARDDAPEIIHPAQIRAIAGEVTKEAALQGAIKGTSPSDLIKKYMLWSYRDIVREFGRPTMTTITQGNPTFQYSFKQGNISKAIQFVFIDGVVFHLQSW